MEIDRSYDVAVVGAGAAGLQAALTLGRMRRRVVLFGTEHCRNHPAEHMHNFIGLDGMPPGDFRAAAVRDLAEYETVEVVERMVTEVSGKVDDFRLAVEGGSPVQARRVILATGVTDELPDVPGLDALFGTAVAHCPYCHGYEYRDKPIGILGPGSHVAGQARLLERLATPVVVLMNGEEPDDEIAAAVEELAAVLVTEAVDRVEPADLGVRVCLADGEAVELGGLFVHPVWRPAAPFAEQLGLDTGNLGGIRLDSEGLTSTPGVYAAGDLAHHRDLPMPVASVLTAAAAGLVAAASCDRDLL
ncbi:NAD(P)/FAD-dependent oxidoreductase [Nocardioides sp. SYSU DS0651]|uniref:NAD(P)/FAD-dependent oxidoreductase n=1 Tax=Nocardioides sp. SYSU DS0651 TaxID=3415955 RepID=UPI003F4C42D1